MKISINCTRIVLVALTWGFWLVTQISAFAQKPAQPPAVDPGIIPVFDPEPPADRLIGPFPVDLPVSTRAPLGHKVELQTISTFTGEVTYRWIKDGVPMAGKDAARLVVGAARAEDAGVYRVEVVRDGATVASGELDLQVLSPSRFVNLSTRADVLADDNILVAGFVIGGSGEKTVLLRGVGPTLGSAAFGVEGALADPELTLFANGSLLAQFDDWEAFGDRPALDAATAASGAFLLIPGGGDAAAVQSLGPGAYSMHIRGKGSATGVALAELFDAGGGSDGAGLINISSRAVAGAGDKVLIPGVVIQGDAPKRVLVRGIGPALRDFGVQGFLADPVLTVFQGEFSVGRNNDWGEFADPQDLAAAMAKAGAFELASGSKDAAAVFTLEPGAYTVVVSGVGESTGAALVELYSIDE